MSPIDESERTHFQRAAFEAATVLGEELTRRGYDPDHIIVLSHVRAAPEGEVDATLTAIGDFTTAEDLFATIVEHLKRLGKEAGIPLNVARIERAGPPADPSQN